MKKNDPKLIINLNLDSPEIAEKIEFAIDQYIDSIIEAKLDAKVSEKVAKYVDMKIDRILREARWDNQCLVNGKPLTQLIEDKARPKVEACITSIIQDLITKKIGETMFNLNRNL